MYDRNASQRIDTERPIAPIGTPRQTDGSCGRCRGHVASDTIMQAMVCMNCGRVAR